MYVVFYVYSIRQVPSDSIGIHIYNPNFDSLCHVWGVDQNFWLIVESLICSYFNIILLITSAVLHAHTASRLTRIHKPFSIRSSNIVFDATAHYGGLLRSFPILGVPPEYP